MGCKNYFKKHNHKIEKKTVKMCYFAAIERKTVNEKAKFRKQHTIFF